MQDKGDGVPAVVQGVVGSAMKSGFPSNFSLQLKEKLKLKGEVMNTILQSVILLIHGVTTRWAPFRVIKGVDWQWAKVDPLHQPDRHSVPG